VIVGCSALRFDPSDVGDAVDGGEHLDEPFEVAA
jgi:hypothetical protein